MKYAVGIIAAFFIISSQIGTQTFAQTPTVATSNDCQQGYGNGQSCPAQHKILVDVLVQDPNTGRYEQSLGPDAAYAPNEPVNFRVDLTNTDTAAKTFPLQTTFPDDFTYAGGPGSYAPETRTTTVSVEGLQPNQTRSFYYTANKTNGGNPQAVDCENYYKGRVTIESATNEDTAQFCIDNRTLGDSTTPGTTKGGQPIYPSQPSTSTPKTGPELMALAALIPAAISGHILRKKSK
jgi:hypothetical protein